MNQVQIEIGSSDLQLLSSLGMRLALFRATRQQNPSPVLWQALGLAPQQAISWDGGIGLFASLAPPSVNSVLELNSSLDSAIGGRVYSLDETLVFSGPEAGTSLDPQTYAIDNGYTASAPIGVGLLGTATVAAQATSPSPLVAASSASPFRSTFEPLDLAYLSVRSDAVAGLVIDPQTIPPVGSEHSGSGSSSPVTAGPLAKLDFASLGPSLVATYDATLGTFRVSAGTSS